MYIQEIAKHYLSTKKFCHITLFFFVDEKSIKTRVYLWCIYCDKQNTVYIYFQGHCHLLIKFLDIFEISNNFCRSPVSQSAFKSEFEFSLKMSLANSSSVNGFLPFLIVRSDLNLTSGLVSVQVPSFSSLRTNPSVTI